MFPPQNPDLKAERLMNYEISLLQMLMDNRLSLGVNLFYIKGDNMIQQPQPNMGQWANIGEVENKGFEVSTTYLATSVLRFSANYSYLDMTYAILAAPEHKLYVSANYSKGRWGISSGVQYIGNIHTSLTGSGQESFVLWNGRINYQALDWLGIFAKGENLLGQKYEINAGYPMPGATISGGIRVRI
ncbi:TonB-dependent receptor [uncultured Proteiniphilum sp.]|uniref:TonB-dependent receptor n=1 Tax=uncultured Proteiniphilum sp. TaxID=497637 RepID=UPI0034500397